MVPSAMVSSAMVVFMIQNLYNRLYIGLYLYIDLYAVKKTYVDTHEYPRRLGMINTMGWLRLVGSLKL